MTLQCKDRSTCVVPFALVTRGIHPMAKERTLRHLNLWGGFA